MCSITGEFQIQKLRHENKAKKNDENMQMEIPTDVKNNCTHKLINRIIGNSDILNDLYSGNPLIF